MARTLARHQEDTIYLSDILMKYPLVMEVWGAHMCNETFDRDDDVNAQGSEAAIYTV